MLLLEENLQIKQFSYHTHNQKHTEEFLKDFPNSKIFVTIRDPRDNLRSGIYNCSSTIQKFTI